MDKITKYFLIGFGILLVGFIIYIAISFHISDKKREEANKELYKKILEETSDEMTEYEQSLNEKKEELQTFEDELNKAIEADDHDRVEELVKEMTEKYSKEGE